MSVDDPIQTIQIAAERTFDKACASLKRRPGVEQCSALCRTANAGYDRKFDELHEAGADIACYQGCSFCCHLRVTVLPHEAVALYYRLRSGLSADVAVEVEARILDRADQIKGMTVDEHYATNIECAFLRGGKCLAYAVRPSACAGYHSMSKDECEYSFRNPSDFGDATSGKPALLELQMFNESQQHALLSATQHCGLEASKGELHTAVAELIRDPSRIEKWRHGSTLLKRSTE